MSNQQRARRNCQGRPNRFIIEKERRSQQGLFRQMHMGETLTFRRVMVMIGLILTAMLPIIFGPRVLPYRLRQVLRSPVNARVDFVWTNKEFAETTESSVRRSFSRYYQEDSQWVYRVFDPVYNLSNEAYLIATDAGVEHAEAVKKLEAYAKSKDFPVEPGECEVILTELRSRGRRMDFYEDLIKPARGKILKSSSFSAGILNAKDYQRELQRSINIISSYWDESSQPVGSLDGPMSIQQVPRLLEAYADAELGRFKPAFRKVYARILSRQIKPSLTYDAERSEEELNRAIERRVKKAQELRRGSVLMEVGRPITHRDLDRLRAEAETYEKQQGFSAPVFRLGGIFALLFITATGFLFYLDRFEPGVFRRSTHLAMILFLSALVLVLLQFGMTLGGLRMTLVPLGIMAGISAITFGPRVGVGTASLLFFTGFITTEAEVGEVIALLGSAWIFCCLAPGVRHRSGLLRSGLVAGAVSFLGINFWRMAGGVPLSFDWESGLLWDVALFSGVWDMGFWVVGSMVLTAALPLVERGFGAATNVTLLELSDQEHPCLRRLVLDAPGTYHHSVVVGNLAEAATEAIGGNPLLARVGSYYHDIGKIAKPEYFTENDRGRSPHDLLTPSISTLIITSHVKDGVDMALAYGLPRAIIDIIEQHHGDTSVGFFLNKAREQAKNPDSVPVASFSYPGPKPQTREAAIVLMADTVEAASRSLREPTPAHIAKLVHRLVIEKVMLGQCDESPLTFRDISTIEKSFVRTLNAMHHSRVRYPDGNLNAKKNGGRQR